MKIIMSKEEMQEIKNLETRNNIDSIRKIETAIIKADELEDGSYVTEFDEEYVCDYINLVNKHFSTIDNIIRAISSLWVSLVADVNELAIKFKL